MMRHTLEVGTDILLKRIRVKGNKHVEEKNEILI